MSGWALLQKLHGIIAVLGLAATLHPVLLVRDDKRPSARTVMAAKLAAGILSLSTALAFLVYPLAYRVRVRDWLLENAPTLHTVWFETKEALGFFALVGVVAGALLLARYADQPQARRAARRCFQSAFVCGLGAAVIGLVVASVRSVGP